MIIWAKILIAAVFVIPVIAGHGVNAGEGTILSSRNVQPEMDAIIPAFERASAYKVSISYATTPKFFKRFDGRMRADFLGSL